MLTEYTHKRIIKSRGANSLDGILNFQVQTISDVTPLASDVVDAPQDLPSLCIAISTNFLAPFCCLLSQLNHGTGTHPVTCIVADGCMSFSIEAAIKFDIPIAQFWPVSPCSLLGFIHFDELVRRGVTPFKGTIIQTMFVN